MEKINYTLLIKLDLLELLHRDADDNVVAERIINEHIIPEKQLNAELLEALKEIYKQADKLQDHCLDEHFLDFNDESNEGCQSFNVTMVKTRDLITKSRT